MEVVHDGARAIGCVPDILGGFLSRLAAEPAIEDDVVYPEARKYRWHCSRVTERIRDIADLHPVPEFFTDRLASEQIAYHRLAADEKFIRQIIPRTDLQASVFDKLFYFLLALRAYLKIILQHARLPVKHEIFVAAFTVAQKREDAIHALDEHGAELLERLVPLAVPVGMRDDVIHGFVFLITRCG